MGAGVWKLHHPCFLVCFAHCRACDGFQIHSGSFCPFGLAIFSLCFALVFALSRTAAFVTTIGLSSETASADTEMKIAPSTLNRNE
jgi:hypothetical protein